MANARLLERLLPAMAAEAGISVAELRELMIPVDMDTTADVSSAEDDVSDVEIDVDDGAASPPAPIASPLRVSGGSHTERVRAVIESRTSHGLVLRTLRHVSYDVLRYMVPSDVVAYLHHLPLPYYLTRSWSTTPATSLSTRSTARFGMRNCSPSFDPSIASAELTRRVTFLPASSSPFGVATRTRTRHRRSLWPTAQPASPLPPPTAASSPKSPRRASLLGSAGSPFAKTKRASFLF